MTFHDRPILEITEPTLTQCWTWLNDAFLYNYNPDFFQVKKCDLGCHRYNIHLRAPSVYMPPKDAFIKFFDADKRNRLLWGRYVNPTMYAQDIERLSKSIARPKKYPTVTSIRFYRDGDDTPTGGGCLIAMTIVWFKEELRIQCYSRANEITKALAADMYFVNYVLRDIGSHFTEKYAELLLRASIDWHITLGVQSRVQAPMYLWYTMGDEGVHDYMFRTPQHDWQRMVQDYFFRYFLYPEREKRRMVRGVAEKFLSLTGRDWLAEYQAQRLQLPEVVNG